MQTYIPDSCLQFVIVVVIIVEGVVGGRSEAVGHVAVDEDVVVVDFVVVIELVAAACYLYAETNTPIQFEIDLLCKFYIMQIYIHTHIYIYNDAIILV